MMSNESTCELCSLLVIKRIVLFAQRTFLLMIDFELSCCFCCCLESLAFNCSSNSKVCLTNKQEVETNKAPSSAFSFSLSHFARAAAYFNQLAHTKHKASSKMTNFAFVLGEKRWLNPAANSNNKHLSLLLLLLSPPTNVSWPAQNCVCVFVCKHWLEMEKFRIKRQRKRERERAKERESSSN